MHPWLGQPRLLPAAVGTTGPVPVEAGGRTIEVPVPAGQAELKPELSPACLSMYACVTPYNGRYMIAEAADPRPDGAPARSGCRLLLSSA